MVDVASRGSLRFEVDVEGAKSDRGRRQHDDCERIDAVSRLRSQRFEVAGGWNGE